MKIYIVCSEYFDLEGENRQIGGVETYVYMLLEVFKELGLTPVIYQMANRNFNIYDKGVDVIGVDVKNKKFKKQILKRKIEKVFNNNQDILLFSTDYINFKNNFKRTISIQHGVAWDIGKTKKVSKIENVFTIIKKMLGSVVKYNRYSYSRKMVCVDYNFVNWYRSQIARIPEEDLYVIPNVPQFLVERSNKKEKNNKVKIIFARRLCEYRGTRVFTNAIKSLLDKYKNIEVTIAGEGPDKEFMESKLKKYENVKFIKYSAEDSKSIHSMHDIAVIPTTGSEGTSLSLLEAMACGCAVIGSNVGGITNILINNYNGLLITSNEKELYHALRKLIEDEELRYDLSIKAKETVEKGFNHMDWKEKWKNVFKEYM